MGVGLGYIAYGSAAETQLKKFDEIQSTAMRVCLGAMKTSPISALQVGMGEMPLELRRKTNCSYILDKFTGTTNQPSSKKSPRTNMGAE